MATPPGTLIMGNNGSVSMNDFCARYGKICTGAIDSNGNPTPCTGGGISGGNNGAYCIAPNYTGNNGSVNGTDWCYRGYEDINNNDKRMLCKGGISNGAFVPCSTSYGSPVSYFCASDPNAQANAQIKACTDAVALAADTINQYNTQLAGYNKTASD